MKAYTVLNVSTRETGRKSLLKKIIASKSVPGVIYLKGGASACVSIPLGEITNIVNDPSGLARVYEVKIDGKKSIFCILKDMQFTQVYNTPRHFDLMQVEEGDVVKVNIPIRVLNKEICPGVKSGGDVYRLLYNVDLKCRVENIPYAIEVDVKNCSMGAKFFLSDIKLPEGCKMINNPILLRVAGKRVIKDVVEDTSATETDSSSAETTVTATDTAGSAATAEAKK